MPGKGKKRRNRKGKKKNVSQEKEATMTPSSIDDSSDVATAKDNSEFDLEAMESMVKTLLDEADKETEGHEQQKYESDSSSDDQEEEEEVDSGVDNETESQDEDEDSVHSVDSEDFVEDYEEEEESESEFETTDESSSSVGQKEDEVLEEGEERCSLDLRNLLATNPHQVNPRLLYQQQKSVSTNKEEDSTTICINGAKIANDEYLLQKASDGCSQLLSGLWKLETEKSDAGPMAILPKFCDVVIPRELVS